MEYAYYNFRTGEYEQRDMPEDWSDYTSQSPAAQNLYRLYMEKGDSSADAALKVLLLLTDLHRNQRRQNSRPNGRNGVE